MNNKFKVWCKESKRFVCCYQQGITLRPDTGQLYAHGFNVTDSYELLQNTGVKDKNGVEIYEGDLLNICYSSSGGDHIHDCIYEASLCYLGGVEFNFVRLAWHSYGYNQYPTSSRLCEKYDSISTVYSNDRCYLIATVDKYTSKPKARYPFNEEKEMSFSSRYFKVIGNKYQNPELLEQCDE